jgi:hypothetical protein
MLDPRMKMELLDRDHRNSESVGRLKLYLVVQEERLGTRGCKSIAVHRALRLLDPHLHLSKGEQQMAQTQTKGRTDPLIKDLQLYFEPPLPHTLRLIHPSH